MARQRDSISARLSGLKTTFDASDDDTRFMRDWFIENKGLKDCFRDGVEECAAVLERLGDYNAAHMVLGAYWCRVPRGSRASCDMTSAQMPAPDSAQ